jgi:hypothetical protein
LLFGARATGPGRTSGRAGLCVWGGLWAAEKANSRRAGV